MFQPLTYIYVILALIVLYNKEYYQGYLRKHTGYGYPGHIIYVCMCLNSSVFYWRLGEVQSSIGLQWADEDEG